MIAGELGFDPFLGVVYFFTAMTLALLMSPSISYVAALIFVAALRTDELSAKSISSKVTSTVRLIFLISSMTEATLDSLRDARIMYLGLVEARAMVVSVPMPSLLAPVIKTSKSILVKSLRAKKRIGVFTGLITGFASQNT